jgi:hypothetical protein
LVLKLSDVLDMEEHTARLGWFPGWVRPRLGCLNVYSCSPSERRPDARLKREGFFSAAV